MSWYMVGSAAISIGGQLLKPKQKTAELSSPVDLNEQARLAIKGNTANEGSIEALLGRANTFNQGEANDLMEQAMPGWGKLQGEFTKTAGDLLQDPYNLPKDMQDNLQRLAAERGISAGTRGEFNDFSLLRDFGINSLQYGQSRINQAGSITQLIAGLTPKVNPLSPMSMYVTPQQSADVAAGNRAYQQESNNATAAAKNLNNDNTWSALMDGVGGLWEAYSGSKLGGSGTNTAPAGGS